MNSTKLLILLAPLLAAGPARADEPPQDASLAQQSAAGVNQDGPAMTSLENLAAMPPLAEGQKMDGAVNGGADSQAVSAGAPANDGGQAAGTAEAKPQDNGGAPPPAASEDSKSEKNNSSFAAWFSGGFAAGVGALGFYAVAAKLPGVGPGGLAAIGALTGVAGALFLAGGIANHDPLAIGVGVGLLAIAGLAMFTPAGPAIAAAALAIGAVACLGMAISKLFS